MQQSSRPQKSEHIFLVKNCILLPGESTCKRSKHFKKGN
ncbi:hypothetical protein HU200_045898 [Digitaria exilis]|uniref:Uncharacterized protein n=1 Tax=Digitaria exilis TaxID=1010633 RepID=A0A835B021_9POAL|nr:hypothetical protein HU200_045898 [Digitaria exilis]